MSTSKISYVINKLTITSWSISQEDKFSYINFQI